MRRGEAGLHKFHHKPTPPQALHTAIAASSNRRVSMPSFIDHLISSTFRRPYALPVVICEWSGVVVAFFSTHLCACCCSILVRNINVVHFLSLLLFSSSIASPS